LQKDPDKFNIKKIIKIEILNNFIGEVSSISFISKIKSKNTIEYIIKKNYEIELNCTKNINESQIIQFSGKIFSIK